MAAADRPVTAPHSMDRQSWSAFPAEDRAATDAALRAQQETTHLTNLPWTVGGSALAGVLLVLALWRVVPSAALLGWLGALLALLGARLLTGVLHRRRLAALGPAAPDDAFIRRWLFLHRAGFLVHGCTWALASLLPLPADDPLHRSVLAVMLTTVAVGSFTVTTFDMAAGLCFGGPVLTLLGLKLLLRDEGVAVLAITSFATLGYMVLTARRAHRYVRSYVAVRLAESAQSQALLREVSQAQAAKAELAEAHHLLTLLVRTTSEGFWFIDNELVTTDANPAMCQILGRTREQVVGRPIYDFVDEANAAIFREQTARRARGLTNGYEIALQRPDGSIIECYNNATPLFDTRGRRVGSVGMFSDISAQKRTEQQLRQTSEALAEKSRSLQLTLDSMSQGIAAVEPDGRFSAYNRQVLQLLELPEEAASWSFAQVARFQTERGDLGPAFENIEAAARPAIATFDPAVAPERYVRRTPSGRHLEVRTRRGPDGVSVRTYSDVTDYVEAQRALTEARDEAERANRAKSHFLSSMSHELRTPMNAILGFGQLLQSDPRQPLTPQQARYVHEILRGGQHLLSLINEVLDLAQVETGKLRISLEPVRVADVLHECVALLKPLADDSGITVALAEGSAGDALVSADRTRFKQVLLNLLSNAIKYNRSGGRVRISCSAGADSVRIAVADDGPGIDGGQRARLFQAFERLGAAHTAVEGAGLGLALSKRLVDAMRGEIGLDSEAGQGSTFWVRLPRARPAAASAAGGAAHAATPAPPEGGRTRHVLYIEDNPVNVTLMQGMLAQRPQVELLTADLPEHGIAVALAERPDLVLLDIQLPGIDGFEVLRRLRAAPAPRRVPGVAVSATAMPEDLDAARRAGFAAYLTKPLDFRTLLELVDRELAAADPA